MVFSSEGGLVEPVCNAVSLHQIKKEFKGSLVDYFKHVRQLKSVIFIYLLLFCRSMVKSIVKSF